MDNHFKQLVIARLESFGYSMQNGDDWVIEYVMAKVESHIKNTCNISSIPEELTHIAIDRVCGEFLLAKKQTGALEGFDLDIAVKQVQTGDTNVVYAIGEGSQTPEQILNEFFNYLRTNGEDEFACYRKIKW